MPAGAQAAPTTGRLLVLLAPPRHGEASAAAARARAVTASADARRAGHQAPAIGLVTVRPAPGASLAGLASRLRADPRVQSVTREHRFTLRVTPNDPAVVQAETAPGTPAGTPIEWWAQRQGFPQAWDVSRGADATVAVIDTGVDGDHPDLQGRIAGSIDLDGDPGTGPATTDEAGHGTFVSSIACATAGNGLGLAGAGYGCSLLVIKSDLSDSSVADAIVTATDRGVQAINMSFGTDGTSTAAPAVVRAIDYAYAHDVVMVAAAADEVTREQGDPANVLQPTDTGPDITAGKGLSVTAANFLDRRAAFAGMGTQISMAAYGAFQAPEGGPRGILGAFPQNLTTIESPPLTIPPTQPCRCRTTLDGDTRYAYLQGTSMAAPMVAATAALIRRVNPALHAADVIRLLKRTAHRPPGDGWTPDLGWGILDAGSALVVAADRTAPVSRLRAPSRVHASAFTLRWRGSDPSPAGLEPSGIEHYEVWRSANGRPARRIATVAGTHLKVRVKRGSRYAWFTLAVDRAGNREARPSRPDARTRAVGPLRSRR